MTPAFGKPPDYRKGGYARANLADQVLWAGSAQAPGARSGGAPNRASQAGWVAEGGRVWLLGEFDIHSRESLREALAHVRRADGRPRIDLSGVSFLDLGCARDLGSYCALYSVLADRPVMSNPSWQALRSLTACGYEVRTSAASVTDDVRPL